MCGNLGGVPGSSTLASRDKFEWARQAEREGCS
jgi:hypothetical protein